ncbi:MAG: antibiotic biosynthesis monooxygenase family protein [Thermoanaerobaculia bacterium]
MRSSSTRVPARLLRRRARSSRPAFLLRIAILRPVIAFGVAFLLIRAISVSGTSRLFRRAEGYLETILLEDQRLPGRYLTVDRWASNEAHDAFLREHRADCEKVDREREALATAERSLGAYWEVLPTASEA